MKAVIVEIRGNRAAALLEDGRFVSIPDNAYSIGQEITLLQRKPVRKKHRISFRIGRSCSQPRRRWACLRHAIRNRQHRRESFD